MQPLHNLNHLSRIFTILLIYRNPSWSSIARSSLLSVIIRFGIRMLGVGF